MKHLVALLAIATACASVQHDPSYDGQTRVERDAAQCLSIGPCTVLQIESGQTGDAVVYLNGGRFGFVTGLSHTTLFIPDSRLDVEHCATIVIRLLAGDTLPLPRECVRPGGHFEMQISPLFSTSWIVGRNNP